MAKKKKSKFVYEGWTNPSELPKEKKYDACKRIEFGSTEWFPGEDVRCKITVKLFYDN